MSNTKIKRIVIDVCEPCLNGEGEVCHTPGCALCRHKVDLAIHPELYETISEYDEDEEWNPIDGSDKNYADIIKRPVAEIYKTQFRPATKNDIFPENDVWILHEDGKFRNLKIVSVEGDNNCRIVFKDSQEIVYGINVWVESGRMFVKENKECNGNQI